MEFELLSAEDYRALSNEAFELRCADVRDEIASESSKVKASDLKAEVEIIKEERARRALLDSFKVEERKAVADGAGTVVEEDGKEERKAVHVHDRTAEALSSDEYVREFARYLNTRGAKLSEEFAQYQTRADEFGVLGDAGILVPLKVQQSIIEKMEDRGTIWNSVTKSNVPGGIDYPVGEFKMEAKWIGETETSDYQKLPPVNDKVSFRYHQLEARHARTLMSEVITPTVYGSKYAEAAADAMIDACEEAILSGTGTGQPLGLFKDPRLTNASAVAKADFTVKGYMEKVKNPIARLASGYRNGLLYMAETTFNYYFEGMTDANGQPVARVNYGIDGEVVRTLFGQRVECLDEKYIPYFDDAASAGKPWAIYGNLTDYVWNSNLQMRADRWEDYENNQFKSRLILIADGKPLDVNGFVKFTAGASV